MPNLVAMTTEADELLSVDEAADRLSITPRAVRHRITSGTLAARKIGRGKTSAYVITSSEVERAKQQPATT